MENSHRIDDFESILKYQSTPRPPTVYKCNIYQNRSVKPYNQKLNAQHVISCVTKQIRAMQSSEIVRNVKKASTIMEKHIKSSLLPLNKLQESMFADPQEPQSFDTQLISDTQLINIAEDFEAQDENTGMTQEFETTFHYGQGSRDLHYNQNPVPKDTIFPILDISLKEPDPELILPPNKYEKVIVHDIPTSCIEKYDVIDGIDIQTDVCFETSQKLNECIKIDDIDELDVTVQNFYQQDYLQELSQQNFTEKSPSPVFDIKSKTLRHNTPAPLIVEFEEFESFAIMAMPIVEESETNEEARFLINSQIIGKELVSHPYSEKTGPISPVIEYDLNSLRVDKESIAKSRLKMKHNVQQTVIATKEEIEPKDSPHSDKVSLSSFKDEILFSSDEEDEYRNPSYKDLPFTCALETSFYESDDVLDKTMYVGFQTASNKSIQIGTVSFTRAQSFLDSIEAKGSLNELIEKCESKAEHFEVKSGNHSTSDAKTLTADYIEGNLKTENLPDSFDKFHIRNNSSEKDNLQGDEIVAHGNKLEGFKIVSSIPIQLSEKPLVKSKNVFGDHNVNVETISSMNKSVELPQEVVKPNAEEPSIDDDIIKEFQNDLTQTELEYIINKIENCNELFIENSKEIDQVEPEVVLFKTASDKNIRISDVALAKGKNLFKDFVIADRSDTFDKDLKVPYNNIGFMTASNKPIKISELSLENTKRVFDKIELNDGDDIDFGFSERKANNADCSNSNLVQKNKNSRSEKIYSKVSKFNNQTRIIRNLTESTEELKEECTRFKTVSKNIVSIPTDSLVESKNIFTDIENSNSFFDKNEDKEPLFLGFEQDDIERTVERSQKICEKLTQSREVDLPEKNNKEIKNVLHLGFSSSNQAFNTMLEVPQNQTNSFNLAKYCAITGEELNSNIENKGIIFSVIHSDNKLHDEKSSNDLQFSIGFKTASKKAVKISEEALTKGKQIFQVIDDDASTSAYVNNINKNKFDKAEKVLAQSKKMLKDLSKDKHTGLFENRKDVEIDLKFKGFSTASNKKIDISEKALANSKKIFQDIPNNEFLEILPDYVYKNPDNSTFKGFQTANNKAIKISEASLAKSRHIFQSIADDKSLTTNVEAERTTSSQFKCFQSASNKPVKISAAAIAKNKAFLQDKTNDEPYIKGLNKNIIDIAPSFKFQGFQTASNKEIKISAEALTRSKQILQKINEESLELNTDTDARNSSNFKDLQTASNREVKVSAEALAKSKQTFQDFNENPKNKVEKHVSTSSNLIGFQTASNKEVKVSADALAKSKQIFQNLKDESKEFIINDVEIASSNFKGFQTASKQEVKISAESLARIKRIFQNIDDVEPKNNGADIDLNANKQLKFGGFQTGNNKGVKVSEEAMAKSRKLLENIDLDIDQNGEAPKVVFDSKFKNTGFQTASNNKVDVTEDALIKSKMLLAVQSNTVHKEQSQMDLDVSNNKKYFENVDTQLLSNFEHSMNEETPKKSRRSGSPILSCPKAKKRKVFQIPYSQKSPKQLLESNFESPRVQKPEKIYNFSSDYKKSKIFNLKYLQKLEEESTEQANIDPYIKKFDFDNLLEFEFYNSRNELTQTVLTIPDLKNIFLNTVNKKLVPEGWLEIQLKLILWKLISYELKFPKAMPLTCTAKNVLEQLKYRYGKELYDAERPALRKIFERDDTAAKMLVLSVVAISSCGDTSQPPEILLTDGWYVIKAVTDKFLGKLVSGGQIPVGCKLVIHGAELVGSEQAVSPWEDTSTIRLKISGNSTRRARWHARLGYHGDSAILAPLSAASLDGGRVSAVRVFVVRVYPALYVDKIDDGSTVTRSERLEHLYQMKFEAERQAIMEKIYEEVEKEILDQDSQDSEDIDCVFKRKCSNSSSRVSKILKTERDLEFTSTPTSSQTAHLEQKTALEREKLLQKIRERVQSKMAELGLALNRNVVTLLKVRVAGLEVKRGLDGKKLDVTRAVLSIWRPNEAITELIKEGSWIEVLNVVPTAIRFGELQISAGRQSVFRQSKYKETEQTKALVATLKRTCYPIKDLVKNPAMATDCNEIDTVGIVFEIDPTMNNFDSNKHQFQNVFLADMDKNIISMNFWGGLKKFGFENVLDTGQVVACMNLQKRAGNSRKNIPQYRVTEFSYFTKNPKSDTARGIIEEIEHNLRKIDKNIFYQECVTLRSNYFVKQINEKVTPYRFSNFDMNMYRNKIFLDSPLAQNSSKKDENLNLSGLDFDSTFKQTNTQELSPKTLLRKRQVQERISKLKRYGEPPPLSPMQILNKSKKATNAFKSPLISKSDVSPGAANSEKNLPIREEKIDTSDCEIQCSPVIRLNRTYVKKSNPVKLNFSKNDSSLSEAVDEFAEEFDGSPPLSLD